MPSRWRATSSRIAKARPSDCTPTRCRSSASSSISVCTGCTSLATAVLRGPTGFSLIFSFERGATGQNLLGKCAAPYQAGSRVEQALHTTISIDVQYYGKYRLPRTTLRRHPRATAAPLSREEPRILRGVSKGWPRVLLAAILRGSPLRGEHLRMTTEFPCRATC